MDQVLAFWNTLRHYRGWIFLGTVFFSLVGGALVFMMPDHYKATTTILVDPQKVPEKYVSPTVSSDPGQRLTTITQQVLSSTRLQQIIDEQALYPELRGKLSREEIVELMRKDITLTVKQGSSNGMSAFTIEYEGNDREAVANVANELAASFIEWNLKNREQQAEDTTEFLSSQLKEAKQNLEEQEKKVSTFKMAHLGEMPEQQAANLQALSQLQVQMQANADALNRLEVERTLLTRGLEPAASGSSAKPTPVTERARLEAQRRELKNSLTDLQRRYTANHPEVKDAADRLARLDEQIKALPPDPPITADNSDNTAITVRLQLLDRESKRLSDEQKRITGQIVAYRTKVDAVPVREQQMAELNRNYSVSKEHYQSLLDKTFSAEMAADLERKQQAEHFTIVDKAQVPEKPFKPKRRLMLLGAVLASFCFSVALAYGKDMLNSSFKIERELRAVLPANVPVLASVPRLDCSADRRKAFRFAVLAVLFTVAGCTLEFMLYLRLHPIL
jgi:polysaccharide chain length determinant protein (PEP-CTERM system associated)